MKNAILVVAVLLLVVGLVDSSQEVRDRAFIQSISVQMDSNHVYTTVSLYDDTVTYKGIGNDFDTSLASAETRQGDTFFMGHTELILFSEDSFSVGVLKSMLMDSSISPNCAVVVSSGEVKDTQSAYDILKTYDRLGEVSIKTASDVIKELELSPQTDIPMVHSNLSYSTTQVYR